jgi:hypothetical protein
MMDQQRRLSEPLRWTPAGRIAVAAVSAIVLLGGLALGIYAATGGFEQKTQAGCIEVTFASTTGGATLRACGQHAREICASPQEHRQIADSLREPCRRAGYPFGSGSQ